MFPSLQTLGLTLAGLAIGHAEGLKFQRRADPVDTSNTQGIQNVLVTDAQQNSFYLPMQFGSGSSALTTYGLVSTTRGDILLPGALAKNASGFMNQGKSVSEGPIYAGPVSAAGWTVPDQDIIYYQNPSTSVPIQANGELAYAGFGIWPNTSTVYQAFKNWAADSFISRILAEPESGPYWTLLINTLQDEGGTDGAFGGLLSIGEIVNISQIFNITEDQLKQYKIPDLGRVTQYPWLNNTGSYGNVTYYAIIDAIKWGNVSATLNSTVPGTPNGKIAAYIDSTYSWIQVPYAVTEQLYKGLENATYRNDTRLWYFKCKELNINITIAGYDYPLSPLTAVKRVDNLNCVGTFQAKPQNTGGDVVLGVPFLKNVYARFAYATRNGSNVTNPYAQLMSVTDIEDAHNDWVAAYNKWSGNSTSSSSGPAQSSSSGPAQSSSSGPPRSSSSGPAQSTPSSSPTSPIPSPTPPPSSSPSLSSSSSPSPTSSSRVSGGVTGAAEDDGKDTKSDPVKEYLPLIIVGAVIGALAIAGGIFFAVRKMRNGRDGKGAYRGLGKPDDEAGPILAPHHDVTEGPTGRYGDGGQARYTDPYKD